MSEHHEAEQPVNPTVDQQAVFDLMRAELFRLFGPGGSFTITLGHATGDDAVFVSTVADSIAWQVAAAMEPERAHEPQHVDVTAADPVPEHELFWKHVESELLRQRTGDAAIPVAVRAA